MAITSWEELEKVMEGMKNQPLMASMSAARQAENLPATDSDFRYWRFSGPFDADTSALCRYLHGKVFDRENPDDNQWLPPVHINCRHWAAPVSSLEAGEEWKGEESLRKEIERGGADPEKVLKEGHFIFQPGRYVDLKIPARASGRHFTIRNRKDPATGELRAVIEWLRGLIFGEPNA